MSCRATVDKLEPGIEQRFNPETLAISVHNQPAVHHQAELSFKARSGPSERSSVSLAVIPTQLSSGPWTRAR